MWLKVRTNAEERQVWQAKASELGVSVSDLVRQSLAGVRVRRRSRSAVDPALLRQLALIGNNLNQLARWANRDKGAVPASAVIARLIEIDRELCLLRRSVEAGGAD